MLKLKEMPEDQLKTEIKDFLKEHDVLVLCTCANNIPRATPMDFYTDKSNDFIIYVAPTQGRKVKNIEENPVISIGIYTPMKTGKVQGMQITASGKNKGLIFLKEGEEEFNSAKKIVRGKRKLILKIIPEKIELLDYSFEKRGFNKLQTLNLPIIEL